MRTLSRLARLAAHVAWGLGLEVFVFPRISEKRRAQTIARWSRWLLDILNVRVSLSGEIPASPTLIAANHVSWLDIFVINSLCPSRFVAKSEIRRWPMIGWLCTRAGTLYLERESRSGLARMNAIVARVLQSGERVAIFPEGTTTTGGTAAHFHASLFEPAVCAQARVVPVAIRFPLPDGSPNPAVAYVGDMTFWQSLRRIVAQREIPVSLDFFAAIASSEKNRRELARGAQALIATALAERRTRPRNACHHAGERQSANVPTRSPCRAPADYS